ncbi:unnamed protein product [Coregonus sp. 'balchen']|nr:unnamed protein product [Coregonus sp. 'balchen']
MQVVEEALSVTAKGPNLYKIYRKYSFLESSSHTKVLGRRRTPGALCVERLSLCLYQACSRDYRVLILGGRMPGPVHLSAATSARPGRAVDMWTGHDVPKEWIPSTSPRLRAGTTGLAVGAGTGGLKCGGGGSTWGLWCPSPGPFCPNGGAGGWVVLTDLRTGRRRMEVLGRRRTCLLFCVTYSACCLTKLSRDYLVLILGRMPGCLSTSLLSTAFEACTFTKAASWNHGLAVGAGLVANMLAVWLHLGPVVPFLLAVPCMGACGWVVLTD